MRIREVIKLILFLIASAVILYLVYRDIQLAPEGLLMDLLIK